MDYPLTKKRGKKKGIKQQYAEKIRACNMPHRAIRDYVVT